MLFLHYFKMIIKIIYDFNMTNLLVQDKMSEKRLLVLRSVYPLALLSMSVN